MSELSKKRVNNSVQHISTLLIIWTLVSNRRRVPWIASCLPTSSNSWNSQKFYKYRRKFHKSWTWKVPPLGSFAAQRKSSTTSSLSNQLAWINEIPWLHYHDDPDDDDYHDDPDDEDYHDPLDHLTSKFPHVRHPWLPSTNRGRSRLLPDSPAGTICNCNWISFHNLTFANKPSRWWTPAAVRWKCEGDPLLEIWNTLQLVFFINRI